MAIERFCNIASSVVSAGAGQFLSEEISSDTIIDRKPLEHRVSQKLNNFYNVLGTAMMTPIEFVKAFLVMDKPLLYSRESAISTILNNQTLDVIIQSVPFDVDNLTCDCSDGWECSEAWPPGNSEDLQVTLKCSTLDTMLASTIELWTSIDWWNGVKVAFNLSYPANTYRFSNSSYARYTFGQAIRSGFLVNDTITTDYEAYFNFCAAEKCTYYKEKSRSFVDIIAILSGLVAGIARILRPIVIVFWELVYRKQLKEEERKERRTRHVEPVHSTDLDSQPEDDILFAKHHANRAN